MATFSLHPSQKQHRRKISQQKAQPTRKTRKYRGEQTVIKNVPTAQGKKSIQILH